MAKVLSHMHSIIRGSVGGVTYTANSYAQIIMRARTVPANPQAEYQELMRSMMSESSELWKAMSQADRDSWKSYAQTLEYSGPLGPYDVPARNVFMGSQAFALYAQTRGFGSVVAGDAPPTLPGFLNIGDVKAVSPTTPSSTGIGFSVTNSSGEDIVVCAWRSFGFEPTKNYYNGPWEQEKAQGVDVATATSGTGEFVDLQAGLKYFMKIRAISEQEPHRLSTEYVIPMIAETIGP